MIRLTGQPEGIMSVTMSSSWIPQGGDYLYACELCSRSMAKQKA